MTDIVIIGGGVAGLSAGARLAPHAQVTLLEAEDALGYHASGRSAALFEENYGAPSVQALNRAGAEYLATENGGYLSPRGFLLLGAPDAQDLYQRDLHDLGADPISVGDACAMVPILDPAKLDRAAFHAAAQDIDTDRLLQDFARKIRGHGGRIETGARITGIDRTGTGWTLRAGDRQWQTTHLINAAGPWADSVARMAGISPIGIRPFRRSMARIAAPGGHDVARWPMFFGAGETWYAKPDAGQLIVSPAEEDPSDPVDAWADDMVLAEGLARYQDMVTEPVTRPTATWAGLRSFAPDRTLVLGPDPSDPGFVWSAGQGGYGFQTAPAAGTLVADLVLGRAPQLDADVVAALSPARFRA